MSLILSIDVGTTNMKAALVDADGQLVGLAKSVKMQIDSDGGGKAEHDPRRLAAALLEVCRQAIGDRGHEIDKLALTSYQFGLVLVDKEQQPLTGVSTFADTTAQAHHAQFLAAIGDVDQMYLRTGCPPIFQYPVNRLHFITTYRPEIRDRTAYVLDSKSFLLHALTGEYVTDYSTANSLGCLDTAGQWDQGIINATGFGSARFPEVRDGFTDAIEVKSAICRELGLTPGTTVAVGLFDGAALAAGMTGFEADMAVGNFGTSGMFRVPTDAPVEDVANGSLQSCLLKPGMFFTGSGINNCTIATKLLLSVVGVDREFMRSDELSVPGANGIMSFPYITGERDKVIGNVGTGMIFGLGLATTREDLVRSFMEGVAFSFVLLKQRLDPAGRIKEFFLGGGGTRNRLWMQIMADALNLPVCLAPSPELGIVGAASLARCGDAEALLENSCKIMRGATVVEPIAANVAIYQEVVARYLAMRESLRVPLLARQGQFKTSGSMPAPAADPLLRI